MIHMNNLLPPSGGIPFTFLPQEKHRDTGQQDQSAAAADKYCEFRKFRRTAAPAGSAQERQPQGENKIPEHRGHTFPQKEPERISPTVVRSVTRLISEIRTDFPVRKDRPDRSLNSPSDQSVNGEQCNEIYGHAYHGVKSVLCQRSFHKSGIFEIHGKIDGCNDTQAVDKDREQPREDCTDGDPAESCRFRFPAERSAILSILPSRGKTGSCTFPGKCRHMDEREDQCGESNDHESDSGTGRRDEQAQTVIHIACTWDIGKGKPAQKLYPPYSGREDPQQGIAAGLAIVKFHSQNHKNTCQVKYEISTQKSNSLFYCHMFIRAFPSVI